MKMIQPVLFIFALMLALQPWESIAAESKIAQIAEQGTYTQLQNYLRKNKRIPQIQLDKALEASLGNRDTNILKALLAAGANPNACLHDSQENVSDDADSAETDGSTDWCVFQNACSNAASSQDWSKVIALINAGAQLDFDIFGTPVANFIATYGNDQAIETMLKNAKRNRMTVSEEESLYDSAKRNKNISARVRRMLH